MCVWEVRGISDLTKISCFLVISYGIHMKPDMKNFPLKREIVNICFYRVFQRVGPKWGLIWFPWWCWFLDLGFPQDTVHSVPIVLCSLGLFFWLFFSLAWRVEIYAMLFCCYLLTESRLTLCHPVDCTPPGPSVYRILQARILEWVAISSSRGSFQPQNRTRISYVSSIGRQVLYH